MIRSLQRGPLSAIILAATNEDIRRCACCQPCCVDTAPGMDLTVGELLQMAARDDLAVFSSKTLWNFDPNLVEDGHCNEGINVLRVFEVLRKEARVRGYSYNGLKIST